MDQKTATLTNNIIKQQFQFTDFDEYADMIGQGDVEHAQLERGIFKGSLHQIVSLKVIISVHKMNRRIVQQGSAIRGYTTFLITEDMGDPFTWRGSNLNANRIGILKGSMEHNSVTLPNFVGMPISIADTYLEELSILLGCENFLDKISNTEIITIDKTHSKQLQRLVKHLCYSEITDENMLVFDLPKLLINAICATWSTKSKIISLNKNLLFRQAQEYIESTIESNFSILELCKELNISERNLRYIFGRNAGVSPKNYIQKIKLNKVRRLIKSNSIHEPINHLAIQYGFWHSGQFAADYKKLFGELPSETI